MGNSGRGNSDRLEEIRQRLVNIGEELEDLGLDALRDAVDRGATKRPPIEKTIAAARRSVDKAARLLEPADTE